MREQSLSVAVSFEGESECGYGAQILYCHYLNKSSQYAAEFAEWLTN